MSLLFSLMVDAAALLMLAALVILFYRFQSVGLFSTLSVFFVNAFFLRVPAFEFGGLNGYPADLVCAVLLISALIRLAFRRLGYVHLAWGALAVVAVLSFYTGSQLYGQKASANEFRQFFYFVAVASYFSSFEFKSASINLLKRACYVTAIVLIGLAIYRWAAEWFGLPALDTWGALRESSPGRVTRTLNAAQTLFVLQTWLLTAPSLMTGKKHKRASGIVALVVLSFVLVLQHRTVWASALACLIFLFGRFRTLLRRPLLLAGSAIAILAAISFVTLVDSSNAVMDSIRYSVQEPLETRHSTLEWRINGWQQLVTNDLSPSSLRDTFLGSRPFGAGLRRRVEGSVVNVSAHNYYVEALMRMGILGLGALLLVYGIVLWKVRRTGKGESQTRGEWSVILTSLMISQLVYFFGYGVGYEQGLFLGTAMSFGLSRFGRFARPAVLVSPRMARLRTSGARVLAIPRCALPNEGL